MSQPIELEAPIQPKEGEPGFVGLLVKSVFEPGANAAVVLAMNVCFFFLILTLFGLAVLTQWNKHVLILSGVTTLLWAAMAWYVLELTRVQNHPSNMPLSVEIPEDEASLSDELKKEK